MLDKDMKADHRGNRAISKFWGHPAVAMVIVQCDEKNSGRRRMTFMDESDEPLQHSRVHAPRPNQIANVLSDISENNIGRMSFGRRREISRSMYQNRFVNDGDPTEYEGDISADSPVLARRPLRNRLMPAFAMSPVAELQTPSDMFSEASTRRPTSRIDGDRTTISDSEWSQCAQYGSCYATDTED
jgi:hypothetical protein